EHDRLSIIDAHARSDFASAEHRLINYVGRKLNGCGNRNTSHAIHTDGVDRAPVINKTFELDDLGNEIEVNSRRISADDWFDFQSHTGISRLPILGRSRCHDNRNGGRCSNYSSSRSAADRWNLWLRVRPRISQFSYDFDDCPLSALSSHAWRREEIDSLLLV